MSGSGKFPPNAAVPLDTRRPDRLGASPVLVYPGMTGCAELTTGTLGVAGSGHPTEAGRWREGAGPSMWPGVSAPALAQGSYGPWWRRDFATCEAAYG